MYKLGLKLWSINTDYYLPEAVKLFKKKLYNFIELYVVPNSIEQLSKWEKVKNSYNIPFVLHAPHFAHGLNLANSEKFTINKSVYKEVEQFREILNAEYTVVHGGIEGSIDETIRQLEIIQPKNILIENKPYKAPFGKHNLCRGYNKEEIEKVMTEMDCGFCLDVGHAICTANSLQIEPYLFLKEFNKLNPVCYHLSDGIIDSETDRHLNFGQGNYDIKKILGIIDTNKNIAIETNKKSKENLNDFEKDLEYINEI